jgi:putative hydrolase of the HAD superfamily
MEIAKRLEAPFEAVTEEEAGRHVRVDTDGPLETSVASVVEALLPRAHAPDRALRAGWPAAVTFDCWNTLLQERNWPVAHGLRVDALCAAVREDGADLDRASVGAAFDVAWQRHMDLWFTGVASGAREVARWSLQELDLPLRDVVVEHLTERFQTASHSGEVVALEGTRDTLRALVEAGVRLGVVCDTGLTPGRVVRQHLERFGLLEFFSAELFSDEVGVPKPDARIFEAALDAVAVLPRDAVHVGDLRRTDVAGARAMGMGSVRLTAAHDDSEDDHAEADGVAESHAALLPMLATWAAGKPDGASD